MSIVKYLNAPSVSLSPCPSIRSLSFKSSGTGIAVGYDNGLIEIYSTVFVRSFLLP